ncbi:uncharacterized protein LOC126734248 [Anthonomus grandis grandis]|uniref:uncharacterized protein LOC126734248 n=1 Tax=Anthonomus grandis grandis TaxID=2921223 RepID=UPI002166B053|nr:uncharacterized protein LOC126734248 [Anthonomus grandis grandis]
MYVPLLLSCLALSYALPQSNYADQANNIGYIGEGLPPEATLGGKVTQLDDLSPEIKLNKTKADLNCAAGSMQIDMKFLEPFYGTVYADFDRNSACQVTGKGDLKYALELPLKGCGTKQDPQRVFTNNIVVRFHPGLEMDGDEIITLVCRYPPPIVMEPETQLFRHEEIVAPREANPLSPLPVLLIICGILFLSLFLLGLAASYLCLRRRPVTVIRSMTPSESDIEKLSESSIALAPIHDSSGSEYPGESHSEIEEHAVIHDNASFSSDGYGYTQEQQVEQVTAVPRTVSRLPVAIREDSPRFDVQVKVKRLSPAPSVLSSKSSEASINLPPSIREEIFEEEEPIEVIPSPMPLVHHPEITQHYVDDVYLRTIREKKIIEDIERQKRQVTEYHTKPKPLPPPQHWDVTIKNYPIKPQPPQWEDFSDVSSISGLTLTPKSQRFMSLPPQPQIDDNKIPLSAPELVGNLSLQPPPPPTHRVRFVSPPPSDRRVVTTDQTTLRTETAKELTDKEEWLRVFNIPKENPEVPNWNVLIRVLQPIEPEDSHVIETAETFNSQLTMTDRMKWRQIITTESTLRTLLTEATVRDDYERISRDSRFEHIYEPPKWDVIIRILSPEDIGPDQKYYFPRRGSLPTLVEYDSDDASSIREPHLYPNSIFRRSLHKSEADLRSMTEMTVDFGRSYHRSSGRSQTVPDSPYLSLHRSLSQPSLGRSISEFTERPDRWVLQDIPSEYAGTPEQTPQLQRSPKLKTFQLPRIRLDSGSSSKDGQAESAWQTFESSRVAQTPGGTTTQEVRREVHGTTRAKWAKPSQPGSKGWFPDSGSESSFK